VALRALSLAGLAAVLAAGSMPAVKAELKDSQGNRVGTATFQSSKAGVKVVVKVSGVSPGKHGLHIHAVGKCDPPGFTTAGGHFNPGGRQHGRLNPSGRHGGDLPNITVGKDGKGQLTYTAKGVTLGEGPSSLLGPEGTALVLHAGEDDEKTDPAGNSGARIACGVIEKT
jgi:superoxide dismutase, Cu-Zn family